MNKVKLPDKPRRHRWVTEAIKAGEEKMSIWPSPDEVTNEKKKQHFLETIAKVGNDPRVINIEKHFHDTYSVVFLFYLDPNA
jgi:hypothetical protein